MICSTSCMRMFMLSQPGVDSRSLPTAVYNTVMQGFLHTFWVTLSQLTTIPISPSLADVPQALHITDLARRLEK